MGFSTIDVVIVIVYMVASVGVGSWIGRRQRNTTDYFLGGRRIPWPAVMFSIVATETSVITFVAIPAVAYGGNLTFLQIALGYVVGRILVAFIFIPAYARGELETAYAFLGNRFGSGMRRTASITFMVTRVLADGVRLFATSIPLALIMKGSGALPDLDDREFYALAILLIGVLTIVYTYVGGIRSVVWMDVVQMTVYVGGAVLAGIIILNRLPDGLESVIQAAGEEDKLQWFRAGTGLSLGEFIRQPYTFFTALVAGAIFSLASHGTDQLIVQRVLTCRSKTASQLAIVVSGFAVLVQFFLFLMLGILLFAFYEGQTAEQLGLTRAEDIFPHFILNEIPSGVSGLIVAALFAAAMSTLSSSLSSLSSAAVLDIYVPLAGRERSEGDLLRISRLVTLAWGIILMAAAFAFIGLKGTIVDVALGIASYTYGGLLGAFLLGRLFKGPSQRDAVIGFFTALVVMTLLIQLVQIAWPLYTVVGSLTAVTVGLISRKVRGP